MFRRSGAIATIILSTLSVTNVPVAATQSRAPSTESPVRDPAAAAHVAGGVSRAAVGPVTRPIADRTVSTTADRVVDVGHRGANAYAPENTIAGLEEGAARHADLVEYDVQQTKDHRLILMHDATLTRTTNVERVFPGRSPWRIRDFTLKEIKRLDAGSWFGDRFTGERVPTLDETLRALDGAGVGMLLEVKQPALYPGIGRRVAAALRANAQWLLPGQLIVQSFDRGFVRSFHGLLPAVTTALLGTPSTGELATVRRYADLINPTHGDVTKAYVARVHSRGLRLYAWTVDDPEDMRRLLDDKVDGIISNRPDVLRRVLDS
jgi:glycerophosphoryl diester phosphodiesterase